MQSAKNKNVSARSSISQFFANIVENIVSAILSALDFVLTPLQNMIGMERMAYFFILPNLLIFGIFVLFPMILNLYYSMTGGVNLFPADRPFVGLQNFQTLFDCQNFLQPNSCAEDLFWRAIYNTSFFVVSQVGGMVFFALLTALILNRNIKGRGFFRSVFFYPVLLSPVVVALIWKWILQREGILNAVIEWFTGDVVITASYILGVIVAILVALVINIIAKDRIHDSQDRNMYYAALGVTIVVLALWTFYVRGENYRASVDNIFTGEKILFLLNANWAKFWVIFVSIWANMGFHVLILLAGLQSIPPELYEASSIDGANKWADFWNITLPLLMPTMFVVLVLALIRAVQVFDQVFVLTGGGPGTATQYMVQYVYKTGFGDVKQFGLSSAASVVLGLALLVLTLFQLRLGSRSSLA